MYLHSSFSPDEVKKQRRFRAVAVVLATTVASLGATVVLPAASASASTPLFTKATALVLPKSAGPTSYSTLTGVSCLTKGNCTAVGSFEDSAGHNQALAALQVNGKWKQAVQLAAPSNEGVYLNAVSCTAGGTCTAVGFMQDTAAHNQAVAIAEVNGVWAKAVVVTSPANAGKNPTATLTGVSCTSATSCVAVGRYVDATSRYHAMVSLKSGASFSPATAVVTPSNAGANPIPSLAAVSCISNGNCIAVGSYKDTASRVQAMSVAQVNGVWAKSVEVTAPSNADVSPNASLFGVSCLSGSTCTSVGFYADNAFRNMPMFTSYVSGVFAKSKVVSPPKATAPNPSAPLDGVSCVSTTNCVAVGYYEDAGSHQQPSFAIETKKGWSSEARVEVPSSAGPNPHAFLDAVSCVSSTACSAVGQFQDKANIEHAIVAVS